MRREREDHTLQTSVLINEDYVRLVDQQNVNWQDRAHFFAVAAQVMRHILIDHAGKHHCSALFLVGTMNQHFEDSFRTDPA